MVEPASRDCTAVSSCAHVKHASDQVFWGGGGGGGEKGVVVVVEVEVERGTFYSQNAIFFHRRNRSVDGVVKHVRRTSIFCLTSTD